MIKPIILVIGTRAEAIKLIPLYLTLLQNRLPTLLCATFQHSELLQQVCDLFKVTPDFNLGVMKKNQDLFYLTQIILEKTKEVYLKTNPSIVIVHGDTTTTMASALAAFYLQIPIGHVEAGLRTGNMHSPFPEEMNRKVVGQIASYHFTPTALSTANMFLEGAPRKQVFCTGNTIVDALKMIKKKIENNTVNIDGKIKQIVCTLKAKKKRIVLLTAHRRESFNGGLERIFLSMKEFVSQHEDVTIIFPVHPNPNVAKAIEKTGLAEEKNIELLPPLAYKELIFLLLHADWVATDSGGIQEEAVTLGKRVLVLRDVTERLEGVWEGSEILVGTDKQLILEQMKEMYRGKNKTSPSTIYGDGKACKRITSILKSELQLNKPTQFLKTDLSEKISGAQP